MKIAVNTEHKFGVFLTAIIMGISLCLGASISQAIGIFVIGAALSWALGSRLRALRLSVAILAAMACLVPLTAAVADHYQAMRAYTRSVEHFDASLPSLAKEHPDLAAGILPRNTDPNAAQDALAGWVSVNAEDADAFTHARRTLDIPHVGSIYFPSNITAHQIAAALRATKNHNQPPNWYLDALDAGIDPGQIASLSTPLEKPKPLDLGTALSEGIVIELPSLVLAIIFFISLLIEHRRRSTPLSNSSDTTSIV